MKCIRMLVCVAAIMCLNIGGLHAQEEDGDQPTVAVPTPSTIVGLVTMSAMGVAGYGWLRSKQRIRSS